MTDEQIKILISLRQDEARLLLDNNEYYLYSGIQRKMVELVRDYEKPLPLNCLQFCYYVNGNSRKPNWRSSQVALFQIVIVAIKSGAQCQMRSGRDV